MSSHTPTYCRAPKSTENRNKDHLYPSYFQVLHGPIVPFFADSSSSDVIRDEHKQDSAPTRSATEITAMGLRNHQKSCVGVDIGSSSVKLAIVSKEADQCRLDYWAVRELPTGTISNGSICRTSVLVDAIGGLLERKRARGSKSALTLPTQLVLLDRLRIPDLPEAEIADSLRWEICQRIPCEVEQVSFDYSIQAETNDERQADCLLAAAPKAKIAEYEKVIRLAGLKASIVDVEALTLHNLHLHSYETDGTSTEAILNIGASTTNVIVFRGNSLLLNRLIPMGGLEYRRSLQDCLGLSSSKAEQQLRRHEGPCEIGSSFDKISEKLALEIQKVFSHGPSALKTPEVATVRICGGGSLILGLPDSLSRCLGLPILPMDPLQKLESEHLAPQEGDLSHCRARFAVAIGLALRMAREK